MKDLKKQLTSLLSDLPDAEASVFELDHVDLFPQLVNTVLAQKRKIYRPEVLAELREKDPYLYSAIFNSFSEGLEQLQAWLEENQDVLTDQYLNEFTRSLLNRQQTELQRIPQALAQLKTNIPPLRENNAQLKVEVQNLAIKEKEHQRLINEGDFLQKRKTTLMALEKEVKEGGLKALEEEVKILASDLANEEAEKDKIFQEKNEALDAKKACEISTKQLIRETSYLGKSQELLHQIKKMVNSHNDIIRKECQESLKDIQIQLDFDVDTSRNLMDREMENQIKKLKKQLNTIDTQLIEKIG